MPPACGGFRIFVKWVAEDNCAKYHPNRNLSMLHTMKMRVLYGKRQLAEKMKKSGGGASPIPFESPTVPQLAIVLNNH